MGETNLMCRIFGHRLSVEINQRGGWCVEQLCTCKRCGYVRRTVNETPVSDRPNGTFGIDDRARDLANARRAAIEWRRKYETLCAEQNGTKRRATAAEDRLSVADATIHSAAVALSRRAEGESWAGVAMAAYRVLFAYLYPERPWPQDGPPEMREPHAARAAEGGEVGRG